MAKAKKKTAKHNRRKLDQTEKFKIMRCSACEKEQMPGTHLALKPFEKVSRKGQHVCKMCLRLMEKYNFAFIEEFIWFQNGRK